MEVFLMQLFNGISVSSILLLAALGLAITFGLMGVINMAHGEFIMTGLIRHMWCRICFRLPCPPECWTGTARRRLYCHF